MMDSDFEVLSYEFEAEREWRTKELKNIKLLFLFISERIKKENYCDVYLKMNIPMIYAHWEGFVVAAYKITFEYLNRKSLNPKQISSKLLTYANKDSYDSLKGKHSFSQKCDFTNKFLKNLEKEIKITGKVDTKSNLKFKVLVELLEIFDIDFKVFEPYKDRINKLVDVRNAIAHGENSIKITYGDVEEYVSIITDMMDKLIIELLKYINQEKYMK